MGAQVATRAWAHCTIADATTAGELCGRWQAAGYMVAEHTTALGEMRMYVTALPPGNAVADTSRAAKVAVCDALGLSKATVIGGPFAAGGAEGESG